MKPTEPRNGSSEPQPGEIISDGAPLKIGSSNIDDVIAQHLIDCDKCREAARIGGPRKLGQRSRHCGTYWHLQLSRAKYEGRVNNIVAHTELGDEAPIIGQLE